METRDHGFWHAARVRDPLVRGRAILAATGAAPEHWIAELMQEVHFPHGAMALWLEHVDYPLVAVIAGLSIIVGDNLWRHHGRKPPVMPRTVVPAPLAQIRADALHCLTGPRSQCWRSTI